MITKQDKPSFRLAVQTCDELKKEYEDWFTQRSRLLMSSSDLLLRRRLTAGSTHRAFWRGAGSVIQIFPSTEHPKFHFRPVIEGPYRDWLKVGRDLFVALCGTTVDCTHAPIDNDIPDSETAVSAKSK